MIDTAAAGQSLFVVGAAGVGKGFVLGKTLTIMRAGHGRDALGGTSSTGLAATRIHGMSLHQGRPNATV